MYISKKSFVIMGVLVFALLFVSTYFAFSKYDFVSTISQKNSNSKNEEVKVEIIKEEEQQQRIVIEEPIENNQEEETKIITKTEVNENKTVKANENTVKEKTIKESTTKENTSKENATKTNRSEEKKDIIAYLNNLDNTVFKEENIRNFGTKAKETFIKITDFVFYGTNLNGVTFNELKDDIKLKVMNIVLKIDSKIEKIHPGYKTEIKLKVTNLKEKLAIKYLEVTSRICDSIGEDSCNEAKKDFKDMKESFGITFDILKVIGKDGLNSIKDWYEIFRES